LCFSKKGRIVGENGGSTVCKCFALLTVFHYRGSLSSGTGNEAFIENAPSSNVMIG
jgi:hypothetical protein